MTDRPCSIAEDGYCHRHGIEHGLETSPEDDLPEAFKPKDRDAYLTQPPGPAQAIEFGHYQGYNAALEAVTPLYLTMRERAEAAERYQKAERKRADHLSEQLDGLSLEYDHLNDRRKVAERERDALQALLLELLTGPTLGLSTATAERMIQDTLRTARGET